VIGRDTPYPPLSSDDTLELIGHMTASLQERIRELEERIGCALRELGVPDEHYPAPVANAVAILQHAFPPAPVGGP
jgi:hypothetical protein